MSQPSRFLSFTTWIPLSSARASGADGGSATSDAEEREALATNEEEESLQQDSEEMGFQDQFGLSEERGGDAIAQIAAAVRICIFHV